MTELQIRVPIMLMRLTIIRHLMSLKLLRCFRPESEEVLVSDFLAILELFRVSPDQIFFLLFDHKMIHFCVHVCVHGHRVSVFNDLLCVHCALFSLHALYLIFLRDHDDSDLVQLSYYTIILL